MFTQEDLEMSATKTASFTVSAHSDLAIFDNNRYNLRDLELVKLERLLEAGEHVGYQLATDLIVTDEYRTNADSMIASLIRKTETGWHFEATTELVVSPKVKLEGAEKALHYFLDGNARFKLLNDLIALEGAEKVTFSFRYSVKSDFPKDPEGIKNALIAASISGYNESIPVTIDKQKQIDKIVEASIAAGVAIDEALNIVKNTLVKTGAIGEMMFSRYRRTALNKDTLEKAQADKIFNLEGQVTFLNRLDEFVEKTGMPVDEAIEKMDVAGKMRALNKQRMTSPAQWNRIYDEVKNEFYPDQPAVTKAAAMQGTEAVTTGESDTFSPTPTIPEPQQQESKPNKPSKVYAKADAEEVFSSLYEALSASEAIIDTDQNIKYELRGLLVRLADMAWDTGTSA